MRFWQSRRGTLKAPLGVDGANGIQMNRRTVLREQLTKAWRTSIRAHYHQQRINSEASLQASFWSKLSPLLPSATRRLFVQPTLKVLGTAGSKPEYRYPDIVVCNSRSVIAMVELKYRPLGKPDWAKDIETFEWVMKNRDHILVHNGRYLGEAVDPREYPLARDVLFVWAGVHKPWDGNLADKVANEMKASFFELHAETRVDATPVLR